MTAPNASRNLLFGVLAVQMGFCRSDQLASAMNDWLRERSLSLDEILVKLDILTPRRRELLVQAVDEHLVLHGPVAALSVQAVRPESSSGAGRRSSCWRKADAGWWSFLRRCQTSWPRPNRSRADFKQPPQLPSGADLPPADGFACWACALEAGWGR